VKISLFSKSELEKAVCLSILLKMELRLREELLSDEKGEVMLESFLILLS
jgi:hypothetical protein